jgi:hypothetical protein
MKLMFKDKELSEEEKKLVEYAIKQNSVIELSDVVLNTEVLCKIHFLK